MLNFLWSLPSGFLIAILAFVVFIPTIIPSELFKPWVKALVSVISLLLVAGELSVLTHNQDQAVSDRKAQDEVHKQEIGSLLQHFSFIEGLLTAENHVNALKVQNTNTVSPESLKSRSLDLSDKILQFLVNRQVAPGFGQGGFGEGGFGGTDTTTDTYQKQTIEMFTITFQNRVTAIRDALAKQGLTDKQLDTEYRTPGNVYAIKTIAERIAALAEKLR
ncbi:MAG: hypothetical protein P4L50_16535 [Anaerolineaceae bacterium]|nr:hypothetical protein [Anaerolineaceae bacterium]